MAPTKPSEAELERRSRERARKMRMYQKDFIDYDEDDDLREYDARKLQEQQAQAEHAASVPLPAGDDDRWSDEDDDGTGIMQAERAALVPLPEGDDDNDLSGDDGESSPAASPRSPGIVDRQSATDRDAQADVAAQSIPQPTTENEQDVEMAGDAQAEVAAPHQPPPNTVSTGSGFGVPHPPDVPREWDGTGAAPREVVMQLPRFREYDEIPDHKGYQATPAHEPVQVENGNGNAQQSLPPVAQAPSTDVVMESVTPAIEPANVEARGKVASKPKRKRLLEESISMGDLICGHCGRPCGHRANP